MLREVPNIEGLIRLGYLSHVSEDICASSTRINLPIAALKIKPVLRIFYFSPKWAWDNFWIKTLIPRTHFLQILIYYYCQTQTKELTMFSPRHNNNHNNITK